MCVSSVHAIQNMEYLKYKNVYIGGSPKQDHAEFGTLVLVQPNQTWMIPVNKIAMKLPKCTKYGIKAWDIYIFKRPASDACLYMGEATPPDPHFLFAIALQP